MVRPEQTVPGRGQATGSNGVLKWYFGPEMALTSAPVVG
jgi:hypothetical protein